MIVNYIAAELARDLNTVLSRTQVNVGQSAAEADAQAIAALKPATNGKTQSSM